jgi:inner membrane protein
LFYLLLLSFAEQIGFFAAYLASTLMIATLIALYSARVLAAKGRATTIFLMLTTLYGYLFFVLQLEDYALIFGSLLLFILLTTVMYLTRNIDWFKLGNKQEG